MAATLLLVGAHCLLRTGELVQLTSSVVKFDMAKDSAVISLGSTKSGKRAGVIEGVQVRLPWLTKIIAAALTSCCGRYFLGKAFLVGSAKVRQVAFLRRSSSLRFSPLQLAKRRRYRTLENNGKSRRSGHGWPLEALLHRWHLRLGWARDPR